MPSQDRIYKIVKEAVNIECEVLTKAYPSGIIGKYEEQFLAFYYILHSQVSPVILNILF